MTGRERWLAALQMKPADRLPFWPKLFGSYAPTQEEPFRSMKAREIHKWIGSDLHEYSPSSLKEIRKNTSYKVIEGKNEKFFIFETKHGQRQTKYQYDAPSDAWHPVDMAIKGVEDIKFMTEWFSDLEVEPDKEAIEKIKTMIKEVGDDGIITEIIGESPLMDFIEWYAGIENAHYLLADYEEEVNELFNAMHELLIKKTRMVLEYSSADLFYFIENTSTTLISPGQFRRYCVRHLQDYGKMAADAGKLLVTHMCGHLKVILPDLANLPVAGFESFTSPTLGNTTLLDGRSNCPDKCLIGGTNAILWLKSTEEIISQLKNDLDELPHHKGIVITSGGVMTPLCKPETIKEVCRWVTEYKVKN